MVAKTLVYSLFILLVWLPVAKARTVLVFDERLAQHSLHVASPYQGYWFEPHDVLQSLALAIFADKDNEVTLCTGNETATTFITLSPRLFYNPYSITYYGDVVAKVFSGDGALQGSFMGSGQLQAPPWFGINTPKKIAEVYNLALQDLAKKIKLSSVSSPETMPCGVLSATAGHHIIWW